jgi:hypothetical protein
MRKTRNFKRLLGERRYRKLFIIATEGMKTEPQYFAIFNHQQLWIHIKCLKSNHDSSPKALINRLEKYIKEEGLRLSDGTWEAWLVVDKDQRSDEQLTELYEWSKRSKNYGFALSNPKFEYWLLLYFEDGTDIKSAKNCDDRLERHIPDYDKKIDPRKFTRQSIDNAIDRAQKRDDPPCDDWPHTLGSTTVYRLVKKILEVSNT